MTETNRTEAFSDAVLAIAITLLVLDLRVPARDTLHGSLRDALGHEWPAYFAYVTSFVVIGIIWINHHSVFRLVGRVDRPILFWNLGLLMCVVAIPFTTSLLSEYLTAASGNARTAAVVYSAVMLGMAITFSSLYAHIVRDPDHLAPGVDPVAARRSLVRFSGLGVTFYVVILGIALVNAIACLAAHLVVALYYCVEQTRGERRAEAETPAEGP